MTQYIRISFKNVEPVRVADDSKSQSGEVATLKYIPGSAFRGLVINELAGEEDFEDIKPFLFSDKVKYLNAYISENGRELMPSPKGFYESKTKSFGKKEIENVVVKGDFEPGYKRAGLGSFCYFENNCIRFYSVDTASDLKIKINLESQAEKRNVFRNEYIKAGYDFVGYIAIEDNEEICDRIRKIVSEDFYIGNGRSQGLGLCRVSETQIMNEIPFCEYMPNDEAVNECYMMLLSDTVMLGENGEPCGLNIGELESKLQVKDLKVAFCSTSTVEIAGYNRKLGLKTSSNTMYEKGSVYKLSFTGSISLDSMKKLSDEGIGIRRNEGFGRIIFLKNYEDITYKLAGEKSQKQLYDADAHAQDDAVMKSVARNYYFKQIDDAMARSIIDDSAENAAKTLKGVQQGNSQLGVVESLILANRYNPKEAEKILKDYFGHAGEKEENVNIQKDRKSVEKFRKVVEMTLSQSLYELFKNYGLKDNYFGIPVSEIITADEEGRKKLDYLLLQLRFINRRGVNK